MPDILNMGKDVSNLGRKTVDTLRKGQDIFIGGEGRGPSLIRHGPCQAFMLTSQAYYSFSERHLIKKAENRAGSRSVG
jgi:hypothetical protein